MPDIFNNKQVTYTKAKNIVKRGQLSHHNYVQTQWANDLAVVNTTYTEDCSANLYDFRLVMSMGILLKLYSVRGLLYLKPDGAIRTHTLF